MPVRSLHSSVLRWPDRAAVHDALVRWANQIVRAHSEVRRVGYYGSYARGDWGVGSDVDVLILVDRTDAPFERRATALDTSDLPVPADVLVYTVEEWGRLTGERGFHAHLKDEVVWVHPTP